MSPAPLADPRPVLVYEYLCAGGEVPGLGPHEAADLHAQGRAMHGAMLADLCELPGVQPGSVTAARGSTRGGAHGWPPTGDAGTDGDGCVRTRAGLASPTRSVSTRPTAHVLHADAATSHPLLLQRLAAQGWVVWAVAPESGGLLHSLAEAVPPSRWLGCTPGAIALAGSKHATRERLARHGVPVPDALCHASTGWVVKPDDGAGCTDTRLHPTQQAAQADAAARRHAAVVEPWVDGAPLSVSLCCSAGRAELLGINHQQIETGPDGTLHYRGVATAAEPVDSPRGRTLEALAQQVAAAVPGLRGFVGIDLVWHPVHGPVVIEVNPRVTSAYVDLSRRLGRNVAAAVLAAMAVRA